jgi:hypothetical protein
MGTLGKRGIAGRRFVSSGRDGGLAAQLIAAGGFA